MDDNSFNGLINFLESSGDLYKMEAGKGWYIVEVKKRNDEAFGWQQDPIFRIISCSAVFDIAEPGTCHTVDYEGYDPILEIPLKGTVIGVTFTGRFLKKGYDIDCCDRKTCEGLCHLENENSKHVRWRVLPKEELPLYMKNMTSRFVKLLKGVK